MKEFEKWFDNWKKDDPERRNNFWYFLMKPFMKIAWKAALEWMLNYANDNDYYYPGLVGEIVERIEEELGQ